MKKIFPLLLIFFSTNGYCEWTQYLQQNDVVTGVYVDKSTITKNKDFIRFWNLQDFKKPQIFPKSKLSYLSMVSLGEIDCRKNKYRLLSINFYQGNMGKNKVVFSLNEDENDSSVGWNFIIPETLPKFIEDDYCK